MPDLALRSWKKGARGGRRNWGRSDRQEKERCGLERIRDVWMWFFWRKQEAVHLGAHNYMGAWRVTGRSFGGTPFSSVSLFFISLSMLTVLQNSRTRTVYIHEPTPRDMTQLLIGDDLHHLYGHKDILISTNKPTGQLTRIPNPNSASSRTHTKTWTYLHTCLLQETTQRALVLGHEQSCLH